jgi:hypothetical protein
MYDICHVLWLIFEIDLIFNLSKEGVAEGFTNRKNRHLKRTGFL